MRCQNCQADLSQPRSVSRVYIAKNEFEHEDSYVLGHYDADGSFEPDSNLSYPLVHHDLRDDSDECQSCDAVINDPVPSC